LRGCISYSPHINSYNFSVSVNTGSRRDIRHE
jgi:hypothetical protein